MQVLPWRPRPTSPSSSDGPAATPDPAGGLEPAMQVSEILRALPASFPWMVLFHLEPLRPLAEEQTIREMFFLPAQTDLDAYSHVVLTPEGPCLAPRAGTALERSGRRLEPLP